MSTKAANVMTGCALAALTACLLGCSSSGARGPDSASTESGRPEAGSPTAMDGAADAEPDGGAEDAESGGRNAGVADAGRQDGPSGPPEPPPPPEWDPSFELAGVGWRDSTVPLCNPYAGNFFDNGVDIWADERGVFVLESIHNDPFQLAPPPYPSGTALHFNDGSGWSTWLDIPRQPGSVGGTSLDGVDGGPLWIWRGSCPVRRVDGPGDSDCVFVDARDIPAVSAVTADSLWLAFEDPAPHITWWTGAAPVTSVEPFETGEIVVAIDGNATEAVVASNRAIYRVTRDPIVATRMRVFDETQEPTALWSDNGDEFWVGVSEGRLLHYETGSWTTISTGAEGPIQDIWSDGETVYFATWSEFGRWTQESGPELLIVHAPGTALLQAIAGDAASGEVYLAFVDGAFQEYACGPGMIVWFDGEHFRRF